MSDAAADFRSRLAQLRLTYLDALPGRLARLREAVATLFNSSAGPQVRLELYRQVHSLAGSAGTYGLPALSILARGAEARLKPWVDSNAPVKPSDQADLMSQLDRMVDSVLNQTSAP